MTSSTAQTASVCVSQFKNRDSWTCVLGSGGGEGNESSESSYNEYESV